MARVDLTSQPERPAAARLRVVTPVPNAEVFIDGASAGPAPFDHNDLAPGKHFVIVRARGYAEWKREVELDPAQPTTLSAELSASGTVKMLSNVSGAIVHHRRAGGGQDAGRARQHRRPASTSSRSSSRATSTPSSRSTSTAASRRSWRPT